MRKKINSSKCDDNDYYGVIEWQIIIKMWYFSAKALPFFICSFFFFMLLKKWKKRGRNEKFHTKFIFMIFPLSLEAWLNLLFITTHNIIRFSHIQKVIYTYSFFSLLHFFSLGCEQKKSTKQRKEKWQFTVLSWLRHISNNVDMCDCKCIHYTQINLSYANVSTVVRTRCV